MKQKFEFSQLLSHSLKLTPSVSLSLEVLQLPILELEEFLKNEVESNPTIEVDEDVSFVLENSRTFSPEGEEPFEISRSKLKSELLREQINLEFDGLEREIALFMVNNLNGSGLLTLPEEEIAEKFGVNLEVVKSVRERVKRLEPVGCGSLSVRELLSVQLEEMGAPQKFLDSLSHLDLIGSPSTFRERAGLSSKEFEEFLSYLKRCDLRPFEDGELSVRVFPEAKVFLESGRVKVEVFSPKKFKFRINTHYLRYATSEELKRYIRENYQRALSLKRAIEQREETLKKVVEAVFTEQKQFLIDGKTLKPLNLFRIDGLVSLHESTVSRCVSGKFVETPFGIYPLRFFFPKGSGDVTTEKIKELIREIIEKEDKSKPLSDDKISKILKDKGFRVARRTVAKYRESMGIPSAFKRRVK